MRGARRGGTRAARAAGRARRRPWPLARVRLLGEESRGGRTSRGAAGGGG